jgi:hypothetical protein
MRRMDLPCLTVIYQSLFRGTSCSDHRLCAIHNVSKYVKPAAD